MKPVNPVGSSDVLGGSVCNESHLPSRPAYVCLVQVKLNLAKQLLRLDVLRLRVYIMLLKCGLQIRRLFFKCRYFVFECRYCFLVFIHNVLFCYMCDGYEKSLPSNDQELSHRRLAT